jgi:acetyltransferase-like isoleucine patch superfamily enzyme
MRVLIISIQYLIYTKIYRMAIDKSALISFSARLDKTNPMGIHIGKGSYIASGVLILSHDFCRSLYADTYIGEFCFIGANALIMAGVTIGNHVIVGSGTVVTKNVPPHCIIVGNPARIIKERIQQSYMDNLLKGESVDKIADNSFYTELEKYDIIPVPGCKILFSQFLCSP